MEGRIGKKMKWKRRENERIFNFLMMKMLWLKIFGRIERRRVIEKIEVKIRRIGVEDNERIGDLIEKEKIMEEMKNYMDVMEIEGKKEIVVEDKKGMEKLIKKIERIDKKKVLGGFERSELRKNDIDKVDERGEIKMEEDWKNEKKKRKKNMRDEGWGWRWGMIILRIID